MPNQPFHGSAAWKKARRVARIDVAHKCQRCGCFLPHGLHVHHKKPISLAPALALEPLNLEPICVSCHNALEPRAGSQLSVCDVDGNPLHPEHPWNTFNPDVRFRR
jgi:hypothetical protein